MVRKDMETFRHPPRDQVHAGRPNTPTRTSGYIHEQAAQSLKNPQTDYIDLYYQHRVESALRSKVSTALARARARFLALTLPSGA